MEMRKKGRGGDIEKNERVSKEYYSVQDEMASNVLA